MESSPYPAYAAECGDPSRTKVLGFGSRPAVLLVDVCRAYTSPDSPLMLPLDVTSPALSAIARLIAAVRSATRDVEDEHVPIFYTQTTYTHVSLLDAGLLVQKHPYLGLFSATHRNNLISVPSSAEGYSELQPRPGDMVHRKKFPSAFFGTNLATQLAGLGVDTVVIGGFLTSVAVRSTALDAMQSGFRPIVVAEACADRGQETHWASLMDHNARYGDVVKLEEALKAIYEGWK